VEDLDAALERATEVGGRVRMTPRDRPEERIRVAELVDTEGNLITVAELNG
jgi:predicted enzyme related to lactoylglutathione lyase